MGERSTGARAVLSVPLVYELWSRLVGGKRGRSTLVREHVRPRAGERVLDLGCGPGELLPFLGDVRYVGVDISEQYIARARERFGERAEFRVGDATRIGPDLRGFDLVIAFGVIHHLDDAGAVRLFRGAVDALPDGGRVVTVDPTYAPGQGRAARAVIARDRGQHVRGPKEYERLAREALSTVETVVRHDLLRIPYSHCILECRSGKEAPSAERSRP
jgi:SAM-dependent methyltransferase